MADKSTVNPDLIPLHLTYTKRWVIAPMHRESSVAEHTYRVMVIARYFAINLDLPGLDLGWVVNHALVHDWGEEMEGDIPGPSKADQYPRKDQIASVVKVADSVETGTWWVLWGNPAAWGNHPYNSAPRRDIEKIRHYAANVPGLLALAQVAWMEITGHPMEAYDQR